MAHVVTERCVNCCYTDCCAVCPVDCFYEVASPSMLVIDPESCIDCTLCVPECPVQAIWGQDELPEAYGEWVERNASLFGGGTVIKTKKDPLPSAISLAEIQIREKEKGLDVKEPSAAPDDASEQDESATAGSPEVSVPVGNQVAAPGGLTTAQATLVDAMENSIYPWRTAQAVARQLGSTEEAVQVDLDALIESEHVRARPPTSTGKIVYAATTRAG